MDTLDPVMEKVLKVLEENDVQAFAVSFGTHSEGKFTVCASICGDAKELMVMVQDLANGVRESILKTANSDSETAH